VSREELERFLTTEGRNAVSRLIQEAEQEGDDFDVAEALDRNLYDALAEYDRSARLSRWLSLRFTGLRTEGRLAEQAVEDVLGALRREIAGASSTKNAEMLKLDLVGFSRGSAILHLVPAATADIPTDGDAEDGQGTLPVAEDRLDDALSVVAELHAAAEQAGDMQRFSGQEALLRGFAALADALDKHGLDMGMTWRSGTGRRRSAELTSHGREYARQYLDRSQTSDITQVNGRVVELDISGSFDVKVGTAVNSPRYRIATGGEEALLGLRLELGQTVHVRVRRRVLQNKVGVVFGFRYEFLNMVTPGDPLI
jgi:hypothetical protein